MAKSSWKELRKFSGPLHGPTWQARYRRSVHSFMPPTSSIRWSAATREETVSKCKLLDRLHCFSCGQPDWASEIADGVGMRNIASFPPNIAGRLAGLR